MKCKAPFLFLATLLAVIAPASAAVVDGNSATARLVRGGTHRPDELLVKFRNEVTVSATRSFATLHGPSEMRELRRSPRLQRGPIDRWRKVRFASGTDLRQARAALLRDPQVEYVEYNYEVRIQRTPNDPNFGQLWGLHNIGQTIGTSTGAVDADIDAPEVWDQHTGSGGVVVAVIDTGVAYNHPDLAANMWVNSGEIPGNGVDDDGNGFIDDVHGYDFVNNDGDPMDDHGHGTHVAGTIAAVGDNGIGVAGVTWHARIMAVKFLDASGSGTTDRAISAVLYAAEMGAKVMNNSWGGGGFSQALLDAIRTADQAGALFVAAAGNTGTNNDTAPNFPSNYDVANVIAVAATDQHDARASFSNTGAKTVHIGAPGVLIYSTMPTVGNTCCSSAAGYGFLSGTSMATPHVAGAAALLASRFPGITHYQLRDRLLSGVDPVAGLASFMTTGGRLNLVRSMEEDVVPPAGVQDLEATSVGSRTVELAWHATGDDGQTGTAWAYELRYSRNPINAGNFAQATVVREMIKPSSPGATDSYSITGLTPGADYYFALRVRDNVGNSSPLSNLVTVRLKAVASVFADNIQAMQNWTVAGSDGAGGPALWHLGAHRVASPTRALYYGRDATLTYDTGARNLGSITSAPIDLTEASDSWLSFAHFLRTEDLAPFDTARVQISRDNGATWTDVYVTSLSTAGMVTQGVSLADFDGSVIRVRFSFDTVDAFSNLFEGWVVDDLVVTATAGNGRPTANAGGPYTGTRNQPITFNGTASSDPEGDALIYEWSFGDGSSGSGPRPTHAYANDGTFTVTLVVSDGTLSSNPATTTATIGAAANQPPIARAGADRTVRRNARVVLDGRASTDADGTIASYRWQQVGGPAVTLRNANTAVADFRAPTPPTNTPVVRTFRLTVTDNAGATAVDEVVITVTR